MRGARRLQGRRRRTVPAVLAAAMALGALAAGPALADLSPSQQKKAQTFQKLSEGIEAYKKGNAKKAVDLLAEVVAVSLNSFRAFYFYGLALKADRQYTRAIEPLSFALELDPTHLQGHVDLGDCYLKRGDLDEALAEYHRSLSVSGGYAPAFDALGRVAESAGDDEKAIEYFRKAIDLNPGFPDASLNLGDLYLRAGRLREAVDLFLKAIAIRPDFAAAYNRLGVAYARQKLGNEAIAALRRAAELESGNPWHPYTIGLIEMEIGNLQRAAKEFDDAIRLDVNYVEAYVAKATLLRRLGDYRAAASLLDEALERPSEDEKLRRDAAALRDEIRSQGEAVQRLAASAASGSATPEEQRELAALRAAAGDWFAAAEALKAAGPGVEPVEQFRLGYYFLRAGSYEEAERAFEQLREVRPQSVPVLFNLGLTLQAQGKVAAAEGVFREALGADPTSARILTALGNVQVLQGRWEAAEESYRRALQAPDDFPGRPRVETILKLLGAAAPASAGAAAPGAGR